MGYKFTIFEIFILHVPTCSVYWLYDDPMM